MEKTYFKTLQDMTGRESGIVLYGETHEGLVCNWSSIEVLPRLDPFGVMVMGIGEKIQQAEHTAMISEIAEICDLYDFIFYNGEMLTGPGKVFYLPAGVIVIVPDDWA